MPITNRIPRSKFERWVLDEIGGTRALSVLLGVSQTAVQHWCAKRATPSAALCEKILKLACDDLTLADILKGTK